MTSGHTLFVENHSDWNNYGSDDEYIDLYHSFYSENLPSDDNHTDLYAEIIMTIDEESKQISFSFELNDEQNGGESDAKMNTEFIHEIEAFIDDSLERLASYLPGYTYNKFSIFDIMYHKNLEKDQFIEYIKPGINDLIDDNTPLMIVIKQQRFKSPEYVLSMINNGADPYIENSDGESALSILMNQKELPESLEALKQKMVLEQIVDHQESYGLSL